MTTENTHFPGTSMEDNLKKALSELLILHLLSCRDCFIGELTETMDKLSNGVLKLVFPYSAVYRLLQDNYIQEGEKRIAPDGRKRQYYHISQQGRNYYFKLLETYRFFIDGVNAILQRQDL